MSLNRVNKIIILFFLVISVFVTFFWQIIQTENFSNFVSKELTERFLHNSNLSVSFSKMEIRFFPPKTILKNVTLKYNDSEKDGFKFGIDEIGLSYKISDLLSNRFNISSLELKGGGVFFNRKIFKLSKEDQDLKKISISKIFKDYKIHFNDGKKIGLREIRLKNIEFNFNNLKFNILDSNLEALEDKLNAKIKISNIFHKNKFQILGNSDIDLIDFDLVLKNNNIRLKYLKIKSLVDSLLMEGGIAENNKRVMLSLSGRASGGIQTLLNILDSNKKNNGAYNLLFKVGGSLGEPTLNGSFKTGKILNKFFPIQNMKGSFLIDKEKVLLKKISLNNNKISSGKKPFKIYNFNKNKFILNKTTFLFKGVHFRDIIHYQKKNGRYKGKLSGEVILNLEKHGLKLNLNEGFKIRDFFFLGSDRKNVILSNKNINLGNSEINFFKNGQTTTALKLSFLNSKAEIIGKVKGNNYNFKCKNALVDLEELGAISGVKLIGKGHFDIELKSKRNKKNLKIKLKGVENFSVLNFVLGNVKSDLDLDLNDLDLKIKNYVSTVGKSSYRGFGTIGFEKKGKLDLNLDMRKIKFYDGKKIFGHYLLEEIKNVNDLFFDFNAKFKVIGELSKSNISVFGKYNFHRFNFLGENIGPGKLKFKFNNNIFKLSEIELLKNNGKMRGKFSYNVKTKDLEGRLSLKSMRLVDLNFYRFLKPGFDSDILATVDFKKNKNKFNIHGDLSLINSSLKNEKIEDSFFKIRSKNKKLIANGDLFGGMFSFNSEIGFERGINNNSFFDGIINIEDIKDILSIVSVHNSKNEDIEGNFFGKINSKFNIFELNKMTTNIKVESLSLSKGDVDFSLNDLPGRIVVEKGLIKKWNLNLKGKGNYIRTIGKGDLNKRFKIENFFKLNADWAEIFSSDIKLDSGTIEGRYVFFNDGNQIRGDLDLKGNDINFNIETMPGNFENLNFIILGENSDFLIQKFYLRYGKGDIKVEGNIKGSFPFPLLDLRFDISNSNVYFLENSNVVFSGKGNITGRDIPYAIDGDFLVFGGKILDPLSKFKGKETKEAQYSQYLPKFKFKKSSNLVDIKANFDIINPLVIKNNFSNLSFDGRIIAFGNMNEPLFKGKLNLIPRISRFIFKGYEFILTDGFVKFNDEFRRKPAELKFTGESVVGEYLIKLNIYGNSIDNKIEFSSTPSLPKEDIFSLLTFGITTNDSQSLEEGDRQAMTSIGLGSLLVEQFRLNEGVTSSLGLKMSILPEFSQDVDSNLLRSEVGGAEGSSKVRSSTKIKLKKKLTDKIDLSISSTLGGSLEPTQEMNLDLKIDSNISLEGVYEIKSSTESDGESSNSAGADLKFQWSFK